MPTKSTVRSARSTSPDSDGTNLSFQDVPTAVAVGKNRTTRAKEYEAHAENMFNMAMRICAGSEKTAPDAAAILAHGGTVAAKIGDLADADERVRKALDIISSGTDNPYLALAMASLPLVAQIMRNHETGDVNGKRRISLRIPFTKKTFGFNVRYKLRNPFLRSMTVDPQQLTVATFSNPVIAQALAEQGVEVAWSPNGKVA